MHRGRNQSRGGPEPGPLPAHNGWPAQFQGRRVHRSHTAARGEPRAADRATNSCWPGFAPSTRSCCRRLSERTTAALKPKRGSCLSSWDSPRTGRASGRTADLAGRTALAAVGCAQATTRGSAGSIAGWDICNGCSEIMTRPAAWFRQALAALPAGRRRPWRADQSRTPVLTGTLLDPGLGRNSSCTGYQLRHSVALARAPAARQRGPRPRRRALALHRQLGRRDHEVSTLCLRRQPPRHPGQFRAGRGHRPAGPATKPRPRLSRGPVLRLGQSRFRAQAPGELRKRSAAASSPSASSPTLARRRVFSRRKH